MKIRLLIQIGSRPMGMNPDSGRQQSPWFRKVGLTCQILPTFSD